MFNQYGRILGSFSAGQLAGVKAKGMGESVKDFGVTGGRWFPENARYLDGRETVRSLHFLHDSPSSVSDNVSTNTSKRQRPALAAE